MQVIMLNDGSQMELSDWQKKFGLGKNQVSKHITLSGDNIACDSELLVAERVLDYFEHIRALYGKPIAINSGYRSARKQEELRKKGYKAALMSPHCYGLALDIDVGGLTKCKTLLDVAHRVKLQTFPEMRVGYKEYWNAGRYFIHIDCAPFFFGGESKGSYTMIEGAIPQAWKIAGLEW